MSGNFFPGQHDEEQVIFFFQKHWVEMIYPLGRFCMEQFIVALLLGFMYFRGQALLHNTEGRIMVIIVILGMLFTAFTFWIRIFNYFLRVIIVTEYRIVDVKHQLFIINDENVIDFRNIQDVSAETHGIFNNIIKCGTLTFVLGGSSIPKVLHNVMHPHKVSARIMQVREIYNKLSKNPIPVVENRIPDNVSQKPVGRNSEQGAGN